MNTSLKLNLMKHMAEKNSNILPVTNIFEAVNTARDHILEGLSVTQPGLKCRWSKINKAVGGSWRFDNIYMIAGPSGAGKSYFLNLLHQDFTDKELNKDFTKPFIILHFCLEMSSSDEILRTLSSMTKKSYSDLLSAHKKLENHEEVLAILETIKDRNIFYIETSGNVNQVYQTIKHFKNQYPKHELVITLDHKLLVEYTDEKNEVALVANVSKMLLNVRKELNALIIPLNQLNDKIEDPKRIVNKSLHAPTKTDIHGSKQSYWICDYVWVMHRPELLNITSYTRENFDTTGLIAMHLIKARKGVPGLVRLKEQFGQGNIVQWEDGFNQMKMDLIKLYER